MLGLIDCLIKCCCSFSRTIGIEPVSTVHDETFVANEPVDFSALKGELSRRGLTKEMEGSHMNILRKVRRHYSLHSALASMAKRRSQLCFPTFALRTEKLESSW